MYSINQIAPPSQIRPAAVAAPEGSNINPYARGFKSLDGHMAFLAQRASVYYQRLDSKQEIAKVGELHLAEVHKLIDAYGGAEVHLSSAVVEFCRKYLGGVPENKLWYGKGWGSAHDLARLVDIQQLLDGFISAQVDFVSDSQLQIQRVTQSYNTTITFMGSLQGSLAEMVKTLLLAMR